MTSLHEDNGGSALASISFSSGVHFWEVLIESLWDSEENGGTLRIGLATEDFDLGNLGDDVCSLGWWDNTVDGFLYHEFPPLIMKQGSVLGILLDMSKLALSFYHNGILVGTVGPLPRRSYSPAFFTRSHFDRLRLLNII
jgi:hypothetical protein